MSRILKIEIDLDRFEKFKADDETTLDVLAQAFGETMSHGWERVLWTRHAANVGSMRVEKVNKCKHCFMEIEMIQGVGWVETRSGDEGGTYDHCPDNATWVEGDLLSKHELER